MFIAADSKHSGFGRNRSLRDGIVTIFCAPNSDAKPYRNFIDFPRLLSDRLRAKCRRCRRKICRMRTVMPAGVRPTLGCRRPVSRGAQELPDGDARKTRAAREAVQPACRAAASRTRAEQLVDTQQKTSQELAVRVHRFVQFRALDHVRRARQEQRKPRRRVSSTACRPHRPQVTGRASPVQHDIALRAASRGSFTEFSPAPPTRPQGARKMSCTGPNNSTDTEKSVTPA